MEEKIREEIEKTAQIRSDYINAVNQKLAPLHARVQEITDEAQKVVESYDAIINNLKLLINAKEDDTIEENQPEG